MNKKLQQTADKIFKHLTKQGKLAENEYSYRCSYRTPDGLKCAVGCMIRDSKYDSHAENFLPGTEGLKRYLPKYLHTDEASELLKTFQMVHDFRYCSLAILETMKDLGVNVDKARRLDWSAWDSYVNKAHSKESDIVEFRG